MALLAALSMLATASFASGSMLASTPPMGWNSWNQFLCNIDENLVKQTADAIVDTGLAKLGYSYVVMDDCWHASSRDEQGRLQPNKERFPSGIPALAEYVHSRGLKFGIYSDIGTHTCQKLPGSHGHFDVDAQTFADWGVDYIKMDFCSRTDEQGKNPATDYKAFSESIKKSGREMLYSVCNWGWREPWDWAGEFAQMWRTTSDIYPWWHRVTVISELNAKHGEAAGPGHWNDPDMLEVGVEGRIFNKPWGAETSLTVRESQAHFSLWAMLAAPLIMGVDVRTLHTRPDILDILSNPEVIAIDQDPLGVQGNLVQDHVRGKVEAGVCLSVKEKCAHTQVWMRPLSDNRVALGLFNRGDDFNENNALFSSETIAVNLSELGLNPAQTYHVRDVWAHKDLGQVSGQFSSNALLPHELQLVVLTPVAEVEHLAAN
eukprot:TRINITY_DN3085_c0_g1::TRINITY_DN3085_c0_g1_i1::g.22263::m.22263 TRINITY_DN3085_c0_g1::TRINITY_DN3085_c0_g1_i1::g.22263  ORF type:complete len:432 (+),score=122.66,sp/Q42656/AGAL_COFAR/44.71/8e-114,Melibiase/PF02065.13/1.2e-22,Melibiase/PF02065.13/0.00058,Glyco_hydro_97/PF10566.4/9.8e-08,TrbC/PF04956.8/0.011,Raffinose_syn/PF05691.7/0.037,DUF1724/PF08350.5/0.26 TRINITY_DN3085_c0_g1_i1:41-1336(+)